MKGLIHVKVKVNAFQVNMSVFICKKETFSHVLSKLENSHKRMFYMKSECFNAFMKIILVG